MRSEKGRRNIDSEDLSEDSAFYGIVLKPYQRNAILPLLPNLKNIGGYDDMLPLCGIFGSKKTSMIVFQDLSRNSVFFRTEVKP